jgi:hypothetical protein
MEGYEALSACVTVCSIVQHHKCHKAWIKGFYSPVPEIVGRELTVCSRFSSTKLSFGYDPSLESCCFVVCKGDDAAKIQAVATARRVPAFGLKNEA